jgi:hypothetical protein
MIAAQPCAGCAPAATPECAECSEDASCNGQRRARTPHASCASSILNPFSNQATGPGWWSASDHAVPGPDPEPDAPVLSSEPAHAQPELPLSSSAVCESQPCATTAAAAADAAPAPRHVVRFPAAEGQPAPASQRQEQAEAAPAAQHKPEEGACGGSSSEDRPGEAESCRASWTEAAAAASVDATCAPLTRGNSSESEGAAPPPAAQCASAAAAQLPAAAHAAVPLDISARQAPSEAGPAPSLQSWADHKLSSLHSGSFGRQLRTHHLEAPAPAEDRCACCRHAVLANEHADRVSM